MDHIVIPTPKGKKIIGPGRPAFIVAEMSGNHNRSLKRALAIVDAAAAAGVDAIKLQTYTPDTITINCDNEHFQVKEQKQWKGQTLYNLYKQAYTPWEWHKPLKLRAEKLGLAFFSTPFDETAVDFLEDLGVEFYKVASFEIVDIPLLQKIGQTRKPVIISRGMAGVKDIQLAVKTLKRAGASQVAVLHCVSAYPAKPAEMNLATIADIARRFGVVSGLSDHTLGWIVPVTAAMLGASIIEKHFTLRRSDGGVDSLFSLEPREMKELVAAVREAEAAVGRPNYRPLASEGENARMRRSLFAVKNIKKGERFTPENVRSIRPGAGLPPKFLSKILGQISRRDIKRGTPLLRKDLIN